MAITHVENVVLLLWELTLSGIDGHARQHHTQWDRVTEGPTGWGCRAHGTPATQLPNAWCSRVNQVESEVSADGSGVQRAHRALEGPEP